jgi:hypothetical protein
VLGNAIRDIEKAHWIATDAMKVGWTKISAFAACSTRFPIPIFKKFDVTLLVGLME